MDQRGATDKQERSDMIPLQIACTKNVDCVQTGAPDEREKIQSAALTTPFSFPNEKPSYEPSPGLLDIMERCLVLDDKETLRREFGRIPPTQLYQIFKVLGFGKCLHQAVENQNLALLRYLVSECKAPLEERNDEGLTVLYKCVWLNWTDGALFLLQSGADILNADQGVSHLSCGYEPMVHLTVRLQNETLLAELVRRGADILAKNSDGYNCLISCPPIYRFTNIVWQKMIEAKLEKGERPCGPDGRGLSDFEEMLYSLESITNVRNLIRTKHPKERKALLLLLGAWYATRFTSHHARRYWKEAEALPPIPCDPTFAPMTRQFPKNSFAWILGDERLRDTLDTDLEKLRANQVRIRSLLVVEALSPDSVELTRAAKAVASDLFTEGVVDTAIALISHLTKIKVLQPYECWEIFDLLKWTKNVFSPIHSLDSFQKLMATTTDCLRFLTSSGTFASSSWTRHNGLRGHRNTCECCQAVDSARQIFTEAMDSFFEIFQTATEEQLHQFYDHVKDFLDVFPRIRGKNILHYFTPMKWTLPRDLNVIKTLVVCSAELRGTDWHKNFPPHLVADHNGDTPLHLMAEHLSKKDLLEGEVLDCFLDRGAHLCTRNNEGKSARDILLERGHLTPEECLPSLQCLAATAFMSDPELRDNVDQCQPNKVKHFLLYH